MRCFPVLTVLTCHVLVKNPIICISILVIYLHSVQCITRICGLVFVSNTTKFLSRLSLIFIRAYGAVYLVGAPKISPVRKNFRLVEPRADWEIRPVRKKTVRSSSSKHSLKTLSLWKTFSQQYLGISVRSTRSTPINSGRLKP